MMFWSASSAKMMFFSVRPEPSTALLTRKRLAISVFSCSV